MHDVQGPDPPTASTVREVESLVRAALPELYAYAIRLTGGDRALAEDLVQEACLAMAARLRGVPGDELTVGWLIVVLRRRFVDHLRRTEREQRRLGDLDAQRSVVDVAWSDINGGDALLALGRLAPEQRAALVFRYVDDLPVRDVARLLGRSRSAAESLLARARRELARCVKEVVDG